MSAFDIKHYILQTCFKMPNRPRMEQLMPNITLINLSYNKTKRDGTTNHPGNITKMADMT